MEREEKEEALEKKEKADSKRRDAEREASDSSWRQQAAEARRHAAEVGAVRQAAQSENQQRLQAEKAKHQTELEKLRGSLLGAINKQFQ